MSNDTATERAQMDADIVCVGFGPATAGFLTTLTRRLMNQDGTPHVESAVMPGMTPLIMCYERADDLSFGVSGVVTRGKFLRPSFPGRNLTEEIPGCADVTEEKVLYMLDPGKVSRRSPLLKTADVAIRAMKDVLPYGDHAFTLPWIPPFMRKHNGMVMSMGQFMQFAGGEIMGTGLAQIWPGTPVANTLPDASGKGVAGVRLTDQGVEKDGTPTPGFLPGMDIHAALTVIGDGPVGTVGQKLDQRIGIPKGNHRREWAVGIKMVVQLPDNCTLKPGTVWHTFGYPEPEIAGFLYVLSDNIATLGIIVPSWFHSPIRTGYTYLQHWMRHPAIMRHIQGGTIRSWGAKTLLESGRRGEPFLCGDGFARIGEGSGTTNILLNSGVDEAWQSGVLLAEGVLQLMEQGKPFTKENLTEQYEARRRADVLDEESKQAQHSRDGFIYSFVTGVIGMGMAGLTGGRVYIPGTHKPLRTGVPTVEEYFKDRIPAAEIARLRRRCRAKGEPLHEALMSYIGWEPIPYDDQLFVTHQDALLMGGKVQAAGSYADHVRFLDPKMCAECCTQLCVEICSGQAITANPEPGPPLFDREKCVHCGACMWNCTQTADKRNPQSDETNLEFLTGAGGLHSAEN